MLCNPTAPPADAENTSNTCSQPHAPTPTQTTWSSECLSLGVLICPSPLVPLAARRGRFLRLHPLWLLFNPTQWASVSPPCQWVPKSRLVISGLRVEFPLFLFCLSTWEWEVSKSCTQAFFFACARLCVCVSNCINCSVFSTGPTPDPESSLLTIDPNCSFMFFCIVWYLKCTGSI